MFFPLHYSLRRNAPSPVHRLTAGPDIDLGSQGGRCLHLKAGSGPPPDVPDPGRGLEDPDPGVSAAPARIPPVDSQGPELGAEAQTPAGPRGLQGSGQPYSEAWPPSALVVVFSPIAAIGGEPECREPRSPRSPGSTKGGQASGSGLPLLPGARHRAGLLYRSTVGGGGVEGSPRGAPPPDPAWERGQGLVPKSLQ